MKLIILLLAIVALVSGDAAVFNKKNNKVIKPLDQECPKEANMNAYVDYVMLTVGPWMNKMGWIPMELPDIEEKFEARPILITYKCLLVMWKGVLDYFEGTVRQGEAKMYYDKMFLRTTLGFALRNIHYRYNYRVVGMDWDFMSQDGWLEGGTDKFAMYTDFLVDIEDFYIYMQDFRVETIGHIWHKLHGNIFTDWLNNAVLSTLTFIFKGILTDFISDAFRDLIQAGLDNINNRGHFQSIEEVESFFKQEDIQQFMQIFRQ